MSNVFSMEGGDHHQGLARTHRLSDGSVYFFLAHSELDEGDQGSLSAYRYGGPTDDAHVLDTAPLTVAPMRQLVKIDERHPSDICFLPEVDGLDAGYVFVTMEFDRHAVACYRWDRGAGLGYHGLVPQAFPTGGPNFLFMDMVGDDFYLGVASSTWRSAHVLSAHGHDLFPGCRQGTLDLSALRPIGTFPFPVTRASQTKLVRDGQGDWFLLGFRSDPSDDPNGTNYIDVYPVSFSPFAIMPLAFSTTITFRPGDTGFSSTGTHHVEHSGRILVSSSYRWAKCRGPGRSRFVSRVDECPSA